MKAVAAGQDLLTIEGYDCCTATGNGGERIVTRADLPACHGVVVRDERGFVWKHMIGCSCVRNQERRMRGLITLEWTGGGGLLRSARTVLGR